MQAFVYEDGEFEVNLFSNVQPMELTKNRQLHRLQGEPSQCSQSWPS